MLALGAPLIDSLVCGKKEDDSDEDTYAHLATYIEVCNTVKLAGVPEDVVWLSLFSFSLSGEAKR